MLGSGIGIACGESSAGEAGDGTPDVSDVPAESEEAVELLQQSLTSGSLPGPADDLLAAWPDGLPPYIKDSYLAAMGAPLPSKIARQETPPYVPVLQLERNPHGTLGTVLSKGRTVETANNAFFQPIGTNGRTCFTCHQMQDGMGLSLRTIRARFAKTLGNDPVFAPVDGANCPNQVSQKKWPKGWWGYSMGIKQFIRSHSLLLDKGLIRIPLPVPANRDYQIEVVSDPTTCNIDPDFSRNSAGTQIISVFRRPLISAAMQFKEKENTLELGPPNPSPISNIMGDGRELTLNTQAIDATLGHAQATRTLTPAEQEQILEFERFIFPAQSVDDKAGPLDVAGANGGPFELSKAKPIPAFPGTPNAPAAVFQEFDGWAAATGPNAARRQAIARGQAIFVGKTFNVSGVSGFNDVVGAPSVPGTCGTCHNYAQTGADILARSQRDIGTGGHAKVVNGPGLSKDLPIFKVTCPAGSFLFDPNLTTVYTNDPAKALITGRCRDLGARTVPTLRGLASREPYFLDGSAATLLDLVNVYNNRFSIGLTPAEKSDLVAFLSSL